MVTNPLTFLRICILACWVSLVRALTMSALSPPPAHGLEPERKLSLKQCRKLSIHPFLASLDISNWGNIKLLQKAFITSTDGQSSDPKTARSIIKGAFVHLAMRKKHDLPLSTYCESLKKYLNHKLVVENFDATYNKELGHYLHDKNMKHLEEEKQIVEIENRSKADLLGVQEIGITLDMRLQKRKRIDQQECDSDSEEVSIASSSWQIPNARQQIKC